MMMRKFFVLAALLAASACSQSITSNRCSSYFSCAGDGQAYQTYALPETIVEYSFAKPASGPWTLSAVARNVPDRDPNYWYRLAYNPHAGAEDDLTLTVKDGLLNTLDVDTSTQLPDVVELVSPVARALAAGTPLSTTATAPPRAAWRSGDPGERRDFVLAQAPVDTLEYRPFGGGAACSIATLLGQDQTNRSCEFPVGVRTRLVRISCDNAERDVLDLDEMRALFGPIEAKSACSGTGARTGTFSFEYAESNIIMTIAADRASPLNQFWTGSGAEAPYSVEGCLDGGAGPAESCFPNGRRGAVFYRSTAPFETAAKLCRLEIVLANSGPDLTRSAPGSCLDVEAQDLAFNGARHRISAVMRRSAYALPMPRGIGADHRKYVFVNGVLESAEIDRTGPLLGIVRLPLTIFGVGDE